MFCKGRKNTQNLSALKNQNKNKYKNLSSILKKCNFQLKMNKIIVLITIFYFGFILGQNVFPGTTSVGHNSVSGCGQTYELYILSKRGEGNFLVQRLNCSIESKFDFNDNGNITHYIHIYES